ncbi:purine nucleoside phosphorylase [Thermoplasmatales archaeon SCGC AB-539-N05]|nr:purine nucleoside phosphorylase [Thermoplasmatales archaeon SCGC AB-539-N05]
MKIGVIGSWKIKEAMGKSELVNIETPYDAVNVDVFRIGSHTVFFVQRHGSQSNLPPHKVNYMANIQAFANSHVECVIALNTVGSLKKTIKPGDFVVPHDFVDFTKSRNYTFYDDKRVHIDMSEPYCPMLRTLLVKSCTSIKNINLHEKAVYLAMEGPRLETPAEICMFSSFCDIVGMTGVPEVVLARERGICYASLCVVSNMAAGLQKTLRTDEIIDTYDKQEKNISKILLSTIEKITEKRDCICKEAIKKAIL